MSKVDCRRRLRNQIRDSFFNKFVVRVLLSKDEDEDEFILMVKFEWNLNEISGKFGRNAKTNVWENFFAALIGYWNFLGGFSYKGKCELISSIYIIKHLWVQWG